MPPKAGMPARVNAGVELGNIRKQLTAFWKEEGDAFSAWWTSAPASERRKAVKDNSIEMPPNRAKAGALALEFNLDEMAGDTATILAHFRDIAAADSVMSLAITELEVIRKAYASKKLPKRMPRPDEIGQIVQFQTSEEPQFGAYFTISKNIPKEALQKLQETVEMGAMVDPVDFDYVRLRLSVKMATCMALRDHFQQDVKPKLPSSSGLAITDGQSQLATRCRSCRKESGNGPDGRLLNCARCRAVWYCSKECQRSDWARHKEECAALS